MSDNISGETRALALPNLLRGAIEAARDEADMLGRLPDHLVTELRDAGAFSLFTPAEYGGLEVSLSTALTVYEQFGRIDTSAAWVVWNANFGFTAAMLGEAGAAKVWTGGREPVLANAGQPGQAVAVDGGYRLSGRWGIVSGIEAVEWFVPLGVVMDGEQPVMTEAGTPDVRLFHVRQDQLKIEHTWNVSGMGATGSHGVVVEDAFVPAELTARIDAPLRLDRPTYRLNPILLVFAGCTAVALGTVEQAIDELVTLAPGKASPFGGLLAEQPHVQESLARHEAAVRAARLFLFDVARRIDETAGQATVALHADLHSAMAHAAVVGRDALVEMYRLGSSTSLYLGNALDRLYRDGMVALQHVNQAPEFFGGSGRVRLGLEPGLPLF
ncbi:acyl-CoA dehydrogenase family protein [Amycolatopsis alba]|uniref:Acyl-CoA dehydrogenase n=1 Tax=Amycolatopsis alba DSM 44262 TaxID=1125972 RepID=A0A229S7S8_AMYAL|nr:acyl-CoA dehydrogenase family protein [Amycolatopsis alba]OXM54950.1 acyl-CoA dehydrogenase [Amycolatopsis alba DSM 44262]